jgi:hypothetical protein
VKTYTISPATTARLYISLAIGALILGLLLLVVPKALDAEFSVAGRMQVFVVAIAAFFGTQMHKVVTAISIGNDAIVLNTVFSKYVIQPNSISIIVRSRSFVGDTLQVGQFVVALAGADPSLMTALEHFARYNNIRILIRDKGA